MENEAKNNLLRHRLIETEDNSYTLFSEAYNEACHSTSGAYEETIYNYINGCDLSSKIKNQDVFKVLDVGFGIGYGLYCLLEFLKNNKPPQKCTYVSIEIDPNLIEYSKKLVPWDKIKDFFDINQLTQKKGNFTYYSDQLDILILIGNGRKTLPTYLLQNKTYFNIIFQDAFSPKKNLDLWTLEWFQLLFKYSTDNVILSTYSASSSVRKTLISSQFIIESKKGFKRKKTMTIARKGGLQCPEILKQLKSDKVAILKD